MNLNLFKVTPDMFDHPSWLHGENHTCRVMSLVWAMGSDMGHERERNLAFCAAYIHDTAREGDGICRMHGPNAADLKLPLYKGFFLQQGIDETDIPQIHTAIHNHSLPEELEKDHPHYLVTALLKDADALDRYRLGPFDLNKKYLRLPETHQYIKVAKKLFLKTGRGSLTFLQALETLESISGRTYPRD